MDQLIYIRGKNTPKLLKHCYFHRQYEDWHRVLQRNVGYENLNHRKIVAIVNDKGIARPVDFQEDRSNQQIEKYCKELGVKLETTGLYFCQGKYRTWEERATLNAQARDKT